MTCNKPSWRHWVSRPSSQTTLSLKDRDSLNSGFLLSIGMIFTVRRGKVCRYLTLRNSWVDDLASKMRRGGRGEKRRNLKLSSQGRLAASYSSSSSPHPIKERSCPSSSFLTWSPSVDGLTLSFRLGEGSKAWNSAVARSRRCNCNA